MKIIKATNSGFFACVCDALRHIHNSQLAGETWHINWGKESLYYDEEKNQNTWQDYFTQPWASVDDAMGHEVSGYSSIPEKGVEFRQVMNRLIKEHIHLNDEVSDLWKRVQDNWMDGTTLGVHMRYTDKCDWQKFNDVEASIPLDIPTYIKWTDVCLEKLDNMLS